MPQQTNPTTKFKVDISELKAGITEANRQIRLATSEFKAASDGTKEWATSADGLSAKLKQLETTLGAEEKKLDLLKQQYTLVAQEQGENSKAAQELLIKINNQQAAVNKTKTAISNCVGALKEFSTTQTDTRTQSEKLSDSIDEQQNQLNNLKKQYADVTLSQGKNSDEANRLATQIEKLSIELKQNKKSLADADSAANKFDKSLENTSKTSKTFQSIVSTLNSKFASGLKTAVASLAGFATAFLALGETAQEQMEDMGKLESAFTSAGYSAETAKESYRGMVGILGEVDQSVEAVNHLAQLTKSQEELSKWTDIAAGVYATFGDSLPIEGLTESANETAKVGEITGSLADALNWAGINEDDFNAQLSDTTTEAERATLITDTLLGLYQEAGDTYKNINGDLIAAREAQADLNDAMAEVGEKSMPILTEIKGGFADVLHAAVDLSGGINFDGVAESVRNGFSYFIDDIMPKIVDGFTWIKDNHETIEAGIVGIGTALLTLNVANIIFGLVEAFKAFKLANEGVTAAQWLLNAAMSANPIGLLVAAITGAVAAIVYLWNTSDDFRGFWVDAWETVKSACADAVDWIVDKFNAVLDFVKNNWAGLLLFLVNPFVGGFKLLYDNFDEFRETVNGFVAAVIGFFEQLPGNIYNIIVSILGHIAAWSVQLIQFATTDIPKFIETVISFIKTLPGRMQTHLLEAINRVISWGQNMVSTGSQKASEFITSVIDFIKTLPEKTREKLDETIEKFISWGLNMVQTGKDAAADTVKDIIDGFSGLPESLYNVGRDALQGFWNGLKDVGKSIKEWAENFFNDILEKAEEVLEIGSPSNAFKRIGKWTMEGFNGELDEGSKDTLNHTKQTFKNVVSTAQNAVQPIASNLKNRVTTAMQGAQMDAKNTVYNFYQTNNSPKALSRLEIYRQSKNLLKGAGKVV